jgi:Holliday junction resolvase
MQEIYLHRDELKTILEFMDSFSESDTVLVKADNSSGIGSFITATLIGVKINGHQVGVTKTISDESNW